MQCLRVNDFTECASYLSGTNNTKQGTLSVYNRQIVVPHSTRHRARNFPLGSLTPVPPAPRPRTTHTRAPYTPTLVFDHTLGKQPNARVLITHTYMTSAVIHWPAKSYRTTTTDNERDTTPTSSSTDVISYEQQPPTLNATRHRHHRAMTSHACTPKTSSTSATVRYVGTVTADVTATSY